MTESTVTASRLDRLAAIRDEISKISSPYDEKIAAIKAERDAALGDLPSEAKDLESDIKRQVLITGRTFVGHSLQAVFYAETPVSYVRKAYAAIKKVGVK